jgi:hypothetical protein
MQNDDPAKPRSTDTRRIELHDPGELAYWLKALDTTHAALLDAVAAVGSGAGDVSDYLKRGSKSEPPPAGPKPDGG